MKVRTVFQTTLAVLLLGLIMLIQGQVVVADEGEDTRNSNPDILFGATLPSNVFRAITAPADGVDVDFFAQDCCMRDDVVEIYVDGCLLATVDSRAGPLVATQARHIRLW